MKLQALMHHQPPARGWDAGLANRTTELVALARVAARRADPDFVDQRVALDRGAEVGGGVSVDPAVGDQDLQAAVLLQPEGHPVEAGEAHLLHRRAGGIVLVARGGAGLGGRGRRRKQQQEAEDQALHGQVCRVKPLAPGARHMRFCTVVSSPSTITTSLTTRQMPPPA
jgi:hypothetical protein